MADPRIIKTIHPENNVYRYIKAKKLVASTYIFENIIHEHPFDMIYIQSYFYEHCFFRSEHTTHSLSFLPGNCVSFLVPEGG